MPEQECLRFVCRFFFFFWNKSTIGTQILNYTISIIECWIGMNWQPIDRMNGKTFFLSMNGEITEVTKIMRISGRCMYTYKINMIWSLTGRWGWIEQKQQCTVLSPNWRYWYITNKRSCQPHRVVSNARYACNNNAPLTKNLTQTFSNE